MGIKDLFATGARADLQPDTYDADGIHAGGHHHPNRLCRARRHSLHPTGSSAATDLVKQIGHGPKLSNHGGLPEWVAVAADHANDGVVAGKGEEGLPGKSEAA
jgi:hypothetical protein